MRPGESGPTLHTRCGSNGYDESKVTLVVPRIWEGSAEIRGEDGGARSEDAPHP